MVKEGINYLYAGSYAPDPKQVSYWIDLKTDPTGKSIKVYSSGKWVPLYEPIKLPELNLDEKANVKEVYSIKDVNDIVSKINKKIQELIERVDDIEKELL